MGAEKVTIDVSPNTATATARSIASTFGLKDLEYGDIQHRRRAGERDRQPQQGHRRDQRLHAPGP